MFPNNICLFPKLDPSSWYLSSKTTERKEEMREGRKKGGGRERGKMREFSSLKSLLRGKSHKVLE